MLTCLQMLLVNRCWNGIGGSCSISIIVDNNVIIPIFMSIVVVIIR